MILCLDVGNSHIYGGVFKVEKLLLPFRYPSKEHSTSDQIGTFLRSVFRENKLNPDGVEHIALCSVVPSLDYSVRAACVKYFNLDPFVLQAGVKTGLQIKCKNPLEVGADRIANAIGAIQLFPNKNIIVVDFGTATTYCVITAAKQYLGGAILPGLRVSMDALSEATAKLFPVKILKPEQAIGRTTSTNIQSGLYFGQLGALREIIQHMTNEVFTDEPPVIIGTGGFAQLFDSEGLFTTIVPDLVLHGIRLALQKNLGPTPEKSV